MHNIYTQVLNVTPSADEHHRKPPATSYVSCSRSLRPAFYTILQTATSLGYPGSESGSFLKFIIMLPQLSRKPSSWLWLFIKSTLFHDINTSKSQPQSLWYGKIKKCKFIFIHRKTFFKDGFTHLDFFEQGRAQHSKKKRNLTLPPQVKSLA